VREKALGLLSLSLFAIFLALAVAIRLSSPSQLADLNVALWVNRLPLGDALSALLVWASLYGREVFWIGLVAVMIVFGDRQTKAVAVGLSAVFVVGIFAGILLKDMVARARPWEAFSRTLPASVTPVLWLPLETDYSFPSGHALIVSIGAAFSLVTFRKKWVAGMLAVEAAAVCFSRVFTFEHFPTDVVGGIALGGAIALAGATIGRRYLAKQTRATSDYLVKLFRDGPLRL